MLCLCFLSNKISRLSINPLFELTSKKLHLFLELAYELYSGFQQANQATIENTQLLKDVHGLKNISDDECRNIAYLSTLMDAFQQENQEHKDSTFLDRITSIEDNKRRWQKMKEIYYGDFDKKFTDMIDKKFIKNLKETTN